MNVSPISSNPPIASAGRPGGAEAPPPEIRQASPTPASSGIATQTEQSLPATQKTEASRQELEDAVKAVNDFLKPINNAIQFNLDDETGKTIVKVIDVETKDVIRQFPSEEMMSIARAIDKMKGLLVQQKA